MDLTASRVSQKVARGAAITHRTIPSPHTAMETLQASAAGRHACHRMILWRRRLQLTVMNDFGSFYSVL